MEAAQCEQCDCGWCTWVDDAGVTLVQGVAAAGHRVAHADALGGAATLDQVVLAARTTHGVPARTRTVVCCQGGRDRSKSFPLTHWLAIPDCTVWVVCRQWMCFLKGQSNRLTGMTTNR